MRKKNKKIKSYEQITAEAEASFDKTLLECHKEIDNIRQNARKQLGLPAVTDNNQINQHIKADNLTCESRTDEDKTDEIPVIRLNDNTVREINLKHKNYSTDIRNALIFISGILMTGIFSIILALIYYFLNIKITY